MKDFSNDIKSEEVNTFPNNSNFSCPLVPPPLRLCHFRVDKRSMPSKYRTRPSGLVQTMSRHTCQTFSALSESKSSQVIWLILHPEGHESKLMIDISPPLNLHYEKYLASTSVWCKAWINTLSRQDPWGKSYMKSLCGNLTYSFSYFSCD